MSFAMVYSGEDIEQGASAAILAMDGNLAREDAKRITRAVLEAAGLKPRAAVLSKLKRAPAEEMADFPEVRG